MGRKPHLDQHLRSQFVGTMPVMLEVSCIISAAAGDWPDFFVILAMVLELNHLGDVKGRWQTEMIWRQESVGVDLLA